MNEPVESPLRISVRAEHTEQSGASLTLPYEARCKSRLKATLDDGTPVGLVLDRGVVMRGGDRLRAENGLVVEIIAAREPVSTATATDPDRFARACYHLGNRHLPLQIGSGWLRYRRDHVIDEMVEGLGLRIVHEGAPFEPESGAYAGGHHHSHGHPTHEHD